jgi:DnaK suppressor protein
MPKREETAVRPKPKTYERVLRAKAEELRRSLSAQRASQVVARQEVPSDEGDLSHQSHEEWLFINRNTLDMRLLREVEQALRRIPAGTFGVCHRCEEPISVKRLNAIPWAKYCVACQEQIALAGGEESVAAFDRAE